MPEMGLGVLLRGIREGAAARTAKPLGETAAEAAARQEKMLPKEVPPAVESPSAPEIGPPAEVQTSPLTGQQETVQPAAVEPAISSQQTAGSEAVAADAALYQSKTAGEAERRAVGVDVQPESQRLSTLELGKYDLGESFQPNYDMMSTTDDIKAIIADAAQRNASAITTSRQGVVTHDELRKLGESMGGEPVALDAVMKWFPGSDLPAPALVLGARQLLVNSADTLLSYARKIVTGMASDQDKIRFRRQLMLHDEFMTSFMGIRAEYGRGLNAFGIKLGPTGEMLNPDLLKEAVKSAGGNIEKLAAKMLEDQTTRGISKVVKRTFLQRWGGVAKAVAMGSALSSPGTQEVNLFGNALMLGMNIAETAVGARLPKLIGMKPTIREGEAAAMLFGAMTGLNDAFRHLWQAVKTGSATAGSRKAETDFANEFTAKAAFKGGKVPGVSPALQKYADGAFDFLGSVAQFWPQRVMVPIDEFSKAISRNSEAARLGYLKALDRSEQEAITPDEFADIIRAYMDNPDEEAIDTFARNMALQGDVAKESPFADWLLELAREVRRFPGGFLIAMFVKTPTILYLEGIGKRSPLAVFNQSWRRDIQAGGRGRDMAMARYTLGSLTTALTASYAASGNITGAGPSDPEERALWMLTHQPYSFRYFNPAEGNWKWQSYARLDPWSYVVGAVADAVEIGARLHDLSDQSDSGTTETGAALARATSAIVAGVVQNTMKKLFLMGPAQFFQTMSDPGRYLPDFLRSNAALFIPWASFRGAINKIEDPLIRQSWDELDQIRMRSGIPGKSNELPPKRDPFGRVIEWPKGEIQGAMSPWPARDAVDDPVVNELLEVTRNTGKVPITMPDEKFDGMKMTGQEWDDFIVMSRSEPARYGEDRGKSFYEAVESLVDSPLYQKSGWEDRLTLLRSKQQQYDSAVRGGGKDDPGQLEKDNPDFAERLADWRVRQDDMKEAM